MAPRRLVPLSLVWVCLSFFAAGAAQGDEEYGRSGPYVGAAGAYAFENFQDEPPGVRTHNKLGYNVRAGYRALSFLAAEVQFEHIRDFERDVPVSPIRSGDGRIEVLTLTGNAKLVYPSGPLQPYALGGAGLLIADSGGALSGSEEDLVARFGGGIDFYFTENIVAVLEGTYVLPFDKVNDLDYVSFTWGLQYRF